MAEPLKVYVFPGAWGLPTNGPFALKLEAWLRFVGIPYDRVEEADPRKGPKGKNPWIEQGGVRMGDTDLIAQHLRPQAKRDLDAHLAPEQRAIALAARRMVEEHLHQVLEYELFVHPDGWRHMIPLFEPVPWPVRPLVRWFMRRHFSRQLRARGVARHAPDVVAAHGRDDLDALVTLLGGREYFFGDQPTSLDAVVYGFVAIFVFSPLESPVATYARTLPTLVAFCERVRATWFPETIASNLGVSR